jgi:hypothetical protein
MAAQRKYPEELRERAGEDGAGDPGAGREGEMGSWPGRHARCPANTSGPSGLRLEPGGHGQPQK